MPRAKAKQLQDIGKCIYGSDHLPPFTEEHILAANMGGDVSLGHASCIVCQKIINQEIEQPCLQKMFPHIRYRRLLGLRRAKQRPTELPIFRRIDVPGEELDANWELEKWQEEYVPSSEHPSLLTLPFYKPPGLLRDVGAATASTEPFCVWTHIEPWQEDKTIKDEIRVETGFYTHIFDRFLAKTAHCATVARYGVDGFNPLLMDIIFGRDISQLRYLIGTLPKIKEPDDGDYKIHFSSIKQGKYRGHIICLIRIFADLHSPTYVVVSGINTLKV